MKNDRNTNTSWSGVAKQYDKHLTSEPGNYHNTVIVPKLLKLIHKYLPNRSAKIVDLACGQGLTTEAISKDGYQVAGADLAPELIQIAKERTKGMDFSVEDASRLSSKFIVENQGSGAVSIVLAIQNIEDLNGVFSQARKILRKGGYIFMVLNHPAFRIPKSTSWEFDGHERQFRRIDSYMSDQKIPIDMAPGKTAEMGRVSDKKLTWSFHRPLQEYVKLLSKNGFAVIDLEEWISNKVSFPGKRAEAENTARKEIPMFMAIVAKLV
jgi:SAM-dependent methyltransferase